MEKKLSYYPGCSLHGTGKEYDLSVRAICHELGIDLEEIPDWNCCGATSAHSVDENISFLLPARNIKKIQEENLGGVLIPCAACFSRTSICDYTLKNDKDKKIKAEDKLNFSFDGKAKIYHLMEFLIKVVGVDTIQSKIKFKLNNLKLVCYYGCLLVRPHNITQLDDKENPMMLDELMNSIGIETLDWPYKTECCGASLSLTRPEIVVRLVGKMMSWAKEAEADAIVTACPLCQANLEMRQQYSTIPVFYFTELLGLAFGLDEIKENLKYHLVDTDPAINKLL